MSSTYEGEIHTFRNFCIHQGELISCQIFKPDNTYLNRSLPVSQFWIRKKFKYYFRIPKPETAIFWTEEGVCPRPLAYLADDVDAPQQPKPEKLAKRESRGPEIFSFKNSNGDEIFGQIYKPENFESSKKYPTIVYVYGGPRVQNIKNQFSASRSERHRMYSKVSFKEFGEYNPCRESDQIVVHLNFNKNG